MSLLHLNAFAILACFEFDRFISERSGGSIRPPCNSPPYFNNNPFTAGNFAEFVYYFGGDFKKENMEK